MAYMIDTFDGHEWWPGAIDWQSREDAIAEAEKRSAKGEFVRVRKASNGAILWPEKHLEDTPCPL